MTKKEERQAEVAAPELLSACKALLAYADSDKKETMYYVAAVDMAAAAIAKVEEGE